MNKVKFVPALAALLLIAGCSQQPAPSSSTPTTPSEQQTASVTINPPTSTTEEQTTSVTINPGTTQATTPAPAPVPAPAPTVQSKKVSIASFAFSPSTITLKAGGTVTWTNKDAMTHTVTSTSGPVSFSSSNLAQGDTFSFTFTQPGTSTYKCSIHPNMTGTVVVQ